ncbi:hypothetical protein P3W43_01390 [Salinicola salarius]|uniref:hypothetical protein n=1 Tax=Salinicola salarius TaxID=430457 RepID=UPI0023E3C8B8|nr:hypothetical protein [Salinicola salarius]MDF3917502.1 hypothetical protein [Salinicola salarius]
MKRLFRSYPVPIWVVAVLVAIAGAGWAGWSSESNNADRLARIATGSMAAVSITMQGRQYEAEKAGQLEAKVDEANGRLGPMQRKINDLQEDVERLRTNWTSELGIEP